MTARRVFVFLALAAAAVTVDFVAYGSTLGNVVHVVAYVAVCTVTWLMVRRLPAGVERRPWTLIAIAFTAWFGGDLIELLQSLFSTVPTVGVADVLWLSGYPLIAAALVDMARRRAPGRLRGAALDTLALTVAAAAAAWQFIVAPTLGQGYSVLETVVPALYPLCDVVLLAGVLFIALTPGVRGAPTRLVLSAVLLYLLIDIAYNVLPFVLAYDKFEGIGALIIFGNALLVAAGLHPGREELTTGADRMPSLHPARVVLLGLALLTAPTLTLLHHGFGGAELVALGATMACSCFILTRFTHAVREQEKTQRQLAYQAHHDPLTGLANRAALDQRLAQFTRDGQSMTVFYLDLDGFKAANDENGHEAGDAILTAVSARLTALVRADDVVARLGGDEFVIVCPDFDTAYVPDLADRIQHAVALPVSVGGVDLTVGVSVGITAPGEAAQNPTQLLRAADAAMYEAKRQGRGRWLLADEPNHLPSLKVKSHA